MIGFWKYFAVSALLFAIMILKEFIVYPNYFAALVGVADSAGDTLVVINFACALTIVWAKFVIFLFFGKLSKNEQQVVYQRGWLFLCNSLLYWGTLDNNVYVNPYNLGVCMLSILVLLILHWISMTRVRALQAVDESEWPWREVFRISRLTVLCTLLLLLDIVMCVVAVERFREQNYTLVLFAFFLIDLLEMGIVFNGELVINLMSLKFLYNHPEEDDWEPAKLAVQVARLAGSTAAMVAHSVLIYVFGLRTSDSWSLVGRLIRLTRNVSGLSKVLSASSEVNKHTIPAVEEDLVRDNICVICRDEMELSHGLTAQKTPKKLHCGHIMHAKCLTSWMAQSETCPTCRRPVRAPVVRPVAIVDGRANRDPQRQRWRLPVRFGWPPQWAWRQARQNQPQDPQRNEREDHPDRHSQEPQNQEPQLQNSQPLQNAQPLQNSQLQNSHPSQNSQPLQTQVLRTQHHQLQALHSQPSPTLPRPSSPVNPLRDGYFLRSYLNRSVERARLSNRTESLENSGNILSTQAILRPLQSSLDEEPALPVHMVESGKGVIAGRYEFFIDRD